LGGFQFVRQLPIGPYFADFCCRKSKLVVELDGSQHADSAYDARRDAFMQAQGWSILRFWNHDVLKQRTVVCETILATLQGNRPAETCNGELRFIRAPSADDSFVRSGKIA
jgi:very-short-patch-repair endonuclease